MHDSDQDALCRNCSLNQDQCHLACESRPFNMAENPEVSAAGLRSFRIKVGRDVGSEIPFVRVLKDEPLRLTGGFS